jgi:hypothetical protein
MDAAEMPHSRTFDEIVEEQPAYSSPLLARKNCDQQQFRFIGDRAEERKTHH